MAKINVTLIQLFFETGNRTKYFKVEMKGKKNLSGLRFVTLANQEIRFFQKIGFLNSFMRL